MTRDDIIRMADEAWDDCGPLWLTREQLFLGRFAALVAAAEREACAKVCDYVHELEVLANPAEKCASAIRARGRAWTEPQR